MTKLGRKLTDWALKPIFARHVDRDGGRAEYSPFSPLNILTQPRVIYASLCSFVPLWESGDSNEQLETFVVKSFLALMALEGVRQALYGRDTAQAKDYFFDTKPDRAPEEVTLSARIQNDLYRQKKEARGWILFHTTLSVFAYAAVGYEMLFVAAYFSVDHAYKYWRAKQTLEGYWEAIRKLPGSKAVPTPPEAV